MGEAKHDCEGQAQGDEPEEHEPDGSDRGAPVARRLVRLSDRPGAVSDDEQRARR
jgi:hypothetical protein